jgi:uncharacterized repeat protein (TIGR01451 family)
MFTPGAIVPNRPTGDVVPPARPSAPASVSPSAPQSAPTGPAATVSVEVTGPEQLSLGQSLTHEIVIRNTSNRPAAEVHVEEPLPAGARALRCEPPAQTRDNRLSWDLGSLEGGAEKRLKVQVQPAGPGEMHLKPVVSFQDGDGLRTRVVRPPFSVELTADHPNVVRGGRVTFNLRAINHGEAPIYNIKLFATLPPGLHHPAVDGSKKRAIGMTLGHLQAGETRPITLETTAAQAGQARMEVLAQADGGIEARTSLDVNVSEPSLALRVDGPKQGITQRDLDFRLEVNNPGPATAKGLRLVQALPAGFEVVGATTGAKLDTAQHSLVWSLPDLAPGQRQVLMFRVKADAAGDWPLYTSVLTDNIPEVRAANVLRIEGAAVLKLEVRAGEDQLRVGQETVYEMHIFNKGDAPCTGVRLTALLPDEVVPLEAKGPVAGQTEKQQVRFASLDKLPARGEAVYRVSVRGKQGGSGHVRVELTADRQPSVQHAVSVQVNGGPAASSGATPVGHIEPTPAEDLR